MINRPPPFNGLNIRIPTIIPIKGRGLLIRGLHYPLALPIHKEAWITCKELIGIVYGYVGIWVVVKIMVPFWVPIIIRHLIFRVPKKGP